MLSSVAEKVENEFAETYTHFKEFQQSPEYRKYWEQCMAAVRDAELLGHIIFCNDVFAIPPVKTFLTVYRDDFIAITGKPNAALDAFIKKSIGAFWGMVFKFALGYTGQKSVSVSMNEYFLVRTASVYSGAKALRDTEIDAP